MVVVVVVARGKEGDFFWLERSSTFFCSNPTGVSHALTPSVPLVSFLFSLFSSQVATFRRWRRPHTERVEAVAKSLWKWEKAGEGGEREDTKQTKIHLLPLPQIPRGGGGRGKKRPKLLLFVEESRLFVKTKKE